MSELKPCPFCGNIGSFWSIDQCQTLYATCIFCGARTVDCDTPEEAIAAWNRRADAVPVVRGEWEVAIGYDPNKKVQCQNCYKMAYEPTAYCPNCGAKMEGKQKDE